MFSLYDVWVSFLSAVCRFWDNRFNHKISPELELLRLELDRAHHQINQLNKVILEIASPSPVNNQQEEQAIPEPIGQKHWRVRARELEEQKRAERKKIDDEFRANQERMTVHADGYKSETVEELEAELGIGAN